VLGAVQVVDVSPFERGNVIEVSMFGNSPPLQVKVTLPPGTGLESSLTFTVTVQLVPIGITLVSLETDVTVVTRTYWTLTDMAKDMDPAFPLFT